MENKDSLVEGGVLIHHRCLEGRHCYEVRKVLNHKLNFGPALFLSKGDKILKINDISLDKLPPEDVTELLTKRCPKLTIHKTLMNETAEKADQKGGLCPFSKDHIVLSFGLEMKPETEFNNVPEEDAKSPTEKKVTWESQNYLFDNLLLVAMVKTRIFVIVGRGCEKGHKCQEKMCSDCHLHEMLMEAGSSKLSHVFTEMKFLQEKVRGNLFIQSLMYDKYIQNRQRTARMSSSSMSSSAKITIYYYKSNLIQEDFRGIPVVLNFSESDCYLHCSKNESGRATLSIQSCEKQRLKCISNRDADILAFLFYMKANLPDSRHFESANCPGWYVQAREEHVGVERLVREDESFYFVIETK